jgi:hypothetical protein
MLSHCYPRPLFPSSLPPRRITDEYMALFLPFIHAATFCNDFFSVFVRLNVYVFVSELNSVWRGNMAVVLQVLTSSTSICVSSLSRGNNVDVWLWLETCENIFSDVLQTYFHVYHSLSSRFMHRQVRQPQKITRNVNEEADFICRLPLTIFRDTEN